MDEPQDQMQDENQNQIDDREEATIGMDEIDNFDFDRATKLMSVMEKVANVAPKATAISGLAGAALEEMNQEAKELAKKRAEAFKELERKRDEALAAQRRHQESEAAAKAEQEAQDKANRVNQSRAADESAAREREEAQKRAQAPRAIPRPTPSDNGRRL